MKDYTKASDFEINKAVERKELIKLIRMNRSSGVTESEEDIKKWTPAITTDYCNDPAAMWPIIVEIWQELNEVSVDDYQNYWCEVMERYNCDALRAAAIVYLIME